jgi:hypothetical protein
MPTVSDFIPDANLHREDADITLFFLSGNGVVSVTPIYDPWYRMSLPIRPTFKANLNGSAMSYGSKLPLQILFLQLLPLLQTSVIFLRIVDLISIISVSVLHLLLNK